MRKGGGKKRGPIHDIGTTGETYSLGQKKKKKELKEKGVKKGGKGEDQKGWGLSFRRIRKSL